MFFDNIPFTDYIVLSFYWQTLWQNKKQCLSVSPVRRSLGEGGIRVCSLTFELPPNSTPKIQQTKAKKTCY
jgi:hypothetical protein